MMGKLQMFVGKLLLHDSSSNMFKRTSKKMCYKKQIIYSEFREEINNKNLFLDFFFLNSEACKSNYENS